MSLSRPLIKFVIDWIRFRLTLPRTSNFMRVKRVLEDAGEDPYVIAHAPVPAGPATEFDVTLQDPVHVRSLHETLKSAWPGSSTMLSSIEVAMDTYMLGADEFELAEIVADRLRWMEYPTTGEWHLYKKRGWGRKLLERYGFDAFTGQEDASGMTQSQLILFLATGWQLTDHAAWTRPPVRYRLQVKRTDQGGKVRLSRSSWRARFEVTLASSVLPWRDLHDLATADFTMLSPYFAFRTRASGRRAARLHPAVNAMIDSVSYAGWQPGRSGAYRRPGYLSAKPRPGRPLKYRSITGADSKLTKMIHDRLRNLGGRLHR